MSRGTRSGDVVVVLLPLRQLDGLRRQWRVRDLVEEVGEDVEPLSDGRRPVDRTIFRTDPSCAVVALRAMSESRTFEQQVDDLAVEHRAKDAKRSLIAAGTRAQPAVIAGLGHPDVRVVVGCIDVIDHVLEEEALDALFSVLGHPDPRVRRRALHALSCEHCKQGECRPSQTALRDALVAACEDCDPTVRAGAVEGLSPMVHDSADALAAIVRLADADPDRAVRKKAALSAPGGPIYEGRRSKSGRLRRRPPQVVERRVAP
jgi:hypothetical protein